MTNYYFDTPIVEVIKTRRSIRNYKEEEISEVLKDKLLELIKNIEGPFDEKVKFKLIKKDSIDDNGGKIGTYGVIKGAKSYIVGSVEKGERDLEQLGYTFEKLILYATSLKLGTCWLGGTFQRKKLQEILGLKENEIIPAITPIGYIEDKKRALDSLMRLVAGSDNRKPWNELFFNINFNTPLEKEEAKEYVSALEMTRLAPSASNKQPWRIVKDGSNLHFFLKSTPGYAKQLGFDIQRIDLGIAMCHFEMTLREQGVKGNWVVNPETYGNEQEESKYIASWIG